LNLRETREHEALSTRRRSLDVKQEENTINGALTLYYERKKKKREEKRGKRRGEDAYIYIQQCYVYLLKKKRGRV
jgi:hypothetical protein